MREKEHRVFIGVGSNIEPQKHILQALIQLHQQIPVTQISTHYRTEPLGNLPQHYYINGIWQLKTSFAPDVLKFDILRNIEQALHRERSEDKHAPRTLDLDILVYDELVIREEGLIIPDPNISTRDFLAIPLCELAPELVIPGIDVPLARFIENFKETKIKPLRHFTKQLQRRIQT